MKMISPLIAGIACLATVSVACPPDNWPQWRGPTLNNLSEDSGVPSRLDKDQNLLWRIPLPGPAGSSPVVWNGKIFLTTITADGSLELHCVSTSGKPVWKRELDGENQDSRDGGNSASPSPCTDGEHVWAMMTDGMLYCFSVDGKPVWKKNIQAYYGEFHIQFGMTSTPVLDNGKLYVQLIHGSMRDRATSTGWVLAFDAKSGKEIWKHKRETSGRMENKHAYTSPVIYRDGDREFLLTHGADYIIAHSLEDGSEIWRCGGLNPPEGYNDFLRFVASPTVAPGMIIAPSAKNRAVLALKTDLQGDVTDDRSAHLWRMDRGTPDVATPVVYRGFVYFARENGILMCVDAKTGEEMYQQRLMADRHRSSPVIADGKLFIAGRNGKIHVVQAGPQLEVLSETDLGETTTASPAIANGRVYIRTFDALYAFGNQ